MRVLFVSPHSWLYGAELSLLLAVRGLAEQGVDPVVVSRGPGPLVDALVREGIEVQAESYRYLAFRWPFPYLAWLRRFAKIVREVKPDVIHCNDRIVCQFVVPVARLAGTPVVCHVRNMTTSSRWRMRLGLSYWADQYIANSDAMRDDLLRHGYNATRVVRIYNPVDTGLFDLACDRQTATPTIGIVGQVTRRKGHHHLFSALAELKGLEWMCAVFGNDADPPEYEDGLRAQVQDSGIANRVSWRGHISGLDAIYGMVDVLAVPSSREPFGRVAAEAMAAGIPVVAFAVDGLREIVVDGETGFLVRSGDVKGLATVLHRLLADAGLRADLGARGRQRARDLFGIEGHVRALVEVYERAIGGTYE